MNDYLDAAARGRRERLSGEEWERRALASLRQAFAPCAREFAAEGRRVAEVLRQSGVKPSKVPGTWTKRYWRLWDIGCCINTNGVWADVTLPAGGYSTSGSMKDHRPFEFDGVGRVELQDVVDANALVIKGREIPSTFSERGYDDGWSGFGVRDGEVIFRESTYSTTAVRGIPFRDALIRAIESAVRKSGG